MELQIKKHPVNKFHNAIMWFTGTITVVLLAIVIISAFVH